MTIMKNITAALAIAFASTAQADTYKSFDLGSFLGDTRSFAVVGDLPSGLTIYLSTNASLPGGQPEHANLSGNTSLANANNGGHFFGQGIANTSSDCCTLNQTGPFLLTPTFTVSATGLAYYSLTFQFSNPPGAFLIPVEIFAGGLVPDNFDIVPLATPLPATLPLFAGGLGIIGLLARMKRRRR